MADPQDSTDEELDRPSQAFELYYAQHGRRTYQAVADQVGVSLRTIKNWASRDNWAARIKERETAVARRVADQALQSGVNDRLRYRQIVRMAVLKLARAINEDRVKLQAADLDRLIRLEDYLGGNGTQNAWLDATAQQIVEAIDALSTEGHQEFQRLLEERDRRLAGPEMLRPPG